MGQCVASGAAAALRAPLSKGTSPGLDAEARACFSTIISADGSACRQRSASTCVGTPPARPLKPEFVKGFEYSDCWVDDARLVVLNARDAADRGAVIETRRESRRRSRQKRRLDRQPARSRHGRGKRSRRACAGQRRRSVGRSRICLALRRMTMSTCGWSRAAILSCRKFSITNAAIFFKIPMAASFSQFPMRMISP